MIEILAMATIIAPVTSGIVQAIKHTKINDHILPFIAVIIGVFLGAGAYFLDVEIGMRVWAGGISGLMSVGLFEVGKNIKEEINNG